MAITEKPKKLILADEEKKARAIINKGLATHEEVTGEKPVTFRLSPDIIQRIDTARKSRRIKTSKQTWFVEAILEKLESEGF